MAYRYVLQPNGLLGRFSDVVDNFTHVNLTPDEALQLEIEAGMAQLRRDASAKVERGLKDELPHTHGLYGDGTARWNAALSTISGIHGNAARQRVKWLVAAGKKALP
jgi:hypothetical protein